MAALYLYGWDPLTDMQVRVDSGDPTFLIPSGQTYKLRDSGDTTSRFALAEDGTFTLGASGEMGTIVGSLIVQENLHVEGTRFIADSEFQVADDYVLLNSGYTADAPRSAGFVFNIDPNATSASVDTGGFSSTTTVEIDTDLGLVAGDIILIKDTNEIQNAGIYEVSSQAGGGPYTVTIKSSPTVELGLGNVFVADSTVQGTVVQIKATWFRAKSTSGLETATGDTTVGLAFTDLSTGGTTATGTNNISWTTNEDGTFALENARNRLRGGDGLKLYEHSWLQNNSARALQFETLEDGTEISSKLMLGTEGQTDTQIHEIISNVHDGDAPTTLKGIYQTKGDFVTIDFGGGPANYSTLTHSFLSEGESFHTVQINDIEEDAAETPFFLVSGGDGAGTKRALSVGVFGSDVSISALSGAPSFPVPDLSPIAGLNGAALNLSSAPGGAADGVNPAGTGGPIRLIGKKGGDASSAFPAANGGSCSIRAGDGGDGTATQSGASGEGVTISPGAPGADNGAGTGSYGDVQIAQNGFSQMIIGNSNPGPINITAGDTSSWIMQADDAANKTLNIRAINIGSGGGYMVLSGDDIQLQDGTATLQMSGGVLSSSTFSSITWQSTGLINIQAADDSNWTMSANDAGDKTLNIGASNSGVGRGDLNLSASDILSIQCGDDSTWGMVANDGGTKTLTISSTNIGGGEGRLNLSSDSQIDISDGTATIQLDGGAITISGSTSADWQTTGSFPLTCGDDSSWGLQANDAGDKTLTIYGQNSGAGKGHLSLNVDEVLSLTCRDSSTWKMIANDASTKTLTIQAQNFNGPGEAHLALAADDQVDITTISSGIQLDGAVFTLQSCTDASVQVTNQVTLTAGLSSTWDIQANDAGDQKLALGCSNSGAGKGDVDLLADDVLTMTCADDSTWRMNANDASDKKLQLRAENSGPGKGNLDIACDNILNIDCGDDSTWQMVTSIAAARTLTINTINNDAGGQGHLTLAADDIFSITGGDDSTWQLTGNRPADMILTVKSENTGGGDGLLQLEADKIGLYTATPVARASAPTAVDGTALDGTIGTNDTVTASLRVTLNQVLTALANIGVTN